MGTTLQVKVIMTLLLTIFFCFNETLGQIGSSWGINIPDEIHNPELPNEMPASVSYAYDAVGNRISRRVIYVSPTSFDPNSQGGGISEIQDQSPLLIDQIDEREIRIYPNPTKGQLKVEFIGDYIPSDTHITIISSQGNSPILQTQMTENPMLIDITPYPDGPYFLTIWEKSSKTTWTIIKH